MMKTRSSLFGKVVMALSLTTGLTTGALHAQPQPQQQMLERLQNMTPEQRQQMLQRLQNMTPQQRQQLQQFLQNLPPEQREQLQQFMENLPPEEKQQLQQLMQAPEDKREAWVRQVLVASGFTDAEVQTSIIDFIRAQEQARAPLRIAAFALSKSLVNPALTDEQLKATLAAYRDAVARDQERYDQQLAALDEKINYSTQPRLELLLSALGVLGQETATLGGIGAIFPDSGFGGNLMTPVPQAPPVQR